jgi:transposase-like protein
VFSPPFCPYKSCPNHRHPPQSRWWELNGFHHTRCFGPVQRFRCLDCRRSFSTQTFHIDFYAKRRVSYRKLERLGSASMSVRALSRELKCSCASVINRYDRLARQELAAHAQLRPQASRYEAVCIDGFVGFDRSQYFPNNITISIAADSRYVLSLTHATLRRSGRMRERQKRRREELYRGFEFESGSIERSFAELLDELARDRPPRRNEPLVIITDEKHEYQRALAAHPLFRAQDEVHRVAHIRVSSKLPRTWLNPLFASNYLDREIRKDQAAHRRESACFSRSAANCLSRLTCYLGWHNYAKRFLIKAPTGEISTHGEEAGIPRTTIENARRRMFRDRAFMSLLKLDASELKIWKKAYLTPGAREPAYLPAYALG